MALFDRSQFEDDEDEAGIHMSRLGAALVVWTAMNYHHSGALTVHDASLAFNTTHAVIREAIDGAMWISYSGPDDTPAQQPIELDGE